MIFELFILVGIGLTGFFSYRLFANPPSFVMYADGFEYAPGSVSTGLIKWSDVAELRETTVTISGVWGPRQAPAAAVVLHRPDEYMDRWPAVLRLLFAFRLKECGSPILISGYEFGRKHAAILEVMREQVQKAQQRA